MNDNMQNFPSTYNCIDKNVSRTKINEKTLLSNLFSALCKPIEQLKFNWNLKEKKGKSIEFSAKLECIELLLKQELSQREIAKRINIGKSSVSRINLKLKEFLKTKLKKPLNNCIESNYNLRNTNRNRHNNNDFNDNTDNDDDSIFEINHEDIIENQTRIDIQK